MSDMITLTGMVLSAQPIGDFDKRLVILTRERGKITAFAKGARRQNSPLLAAVNPFVFGQFAMYEGKTSYRLISADIQNYFLELTQDVEGACYGFYFMEFADYYTRENAEELQMLKLLYAALRALANPRLDDRLVRYVFELRAMMLNGEYPEVFQCVECGKREDLCYFAPQKNSLVCEACGKFIEAKIPVQESTVYTLQYVISAPIEKLFSFAVTDTVLAEFAKVQDRFREMYIEKRFKSLDILRSMVNY